MGARTIGLLAIRFDQNKTESASSSLLSSAQERMRVSIIIYALCLIGQSLADKRFFHAQSNRQLRRLIELLIDEIADRSQCIVSIVDTYYRRKIETRQFMGANYLPMYRILVRDNEEFEPPRKRLLKILNESNHFGCDVYLIFLTNGLQVANFLRYTEEERLINAQGKFIFIYDFRIFHTDLKYLWNRIVNVIFIRHYVAVKRRANRQLTQYEWYDLNTIPFPARTKGLVVTRYIDTWYQNRFRYGLAHFTTKTQDLRKQKLRVAIYEHIPAVTEDAKLFYKDQKDVSYNTKPLGIEFEILLIIARKLNFRPDFYEPENIQVERWGDTINDSFSGLFGEARDVSATFYLGDLHYTMRHLQILDLSWPYNTECLTFLTLESLTEDSWKLLILPFKLITWLALIFTLFLAGITFYIFARFYEYCIELKEKAVNESNINKNLIDHKHPKNFGKKVQIEEFNGLYLFSESVNSFLYTYSMLLQVSLPSLPRAWSLRVFIGWWWIFSILITVTYKASMTASLANSVKRVTIDSIDELVKSGISVGSWSDETKEFFHNSSDEDLQKLSRRYVTTTDEQDALAAVANESLCYYENVHVLTRERVKRQILEVELQKNGSQDEKQEFMDHNLHIMEECVVNMPISIGMDKHSPLKHRVDKIVKRVIEGGFVNKWLSDITQQSKVLELRQEGTAQKALIDLDKLQGAMVALIFGYFLSIILFGAELWHWKYVVLKDPNFNKYRLDSFYKKK